MATNTQPAIWTAQLGSNADVNALPETSSGGEASMKELFPARTQLPLDAGGVAPTRADFNALFKLLGDNIYFIQRGGLYAWDATVSYDKGAVVLYGSAAYASLADSNQGNTPGSSTAWSAVALMNDVNRAAPAGAVMPYAGTSSVPDGWLLCNGALVSRVTYSALYAAIGTAYGAGDGSTTFALPDYRDRVLQGASASHAAGSYIKAGLPNITGDLRGAFAAFPGKQSTERALLWYYGDERTPGGYNPTTLNIAISATPVGDGGNAGDALINASLCNSLYGASSTVQPLAASVQYLIKY